MDKEEPGNLLVLFNCCFFYFTLFLGSFDVQYHYITPYILQMEGIPGKARNLQMHMLMGKLYRNSRHIRPAIACYKECLRFDNLNFLIPAALHFIF